MDVLKRLFLRYLKAQWGRLLAALACMVGATILRMVVPAVTGWIVDGLRGAANLRAGLAVIAWGSGLILASTLVRGAFQYGQTSLAGLVGQESIYRIRNDLYAHMQQLPFSFYDQAQTGQLLSRATADVETLRQFLGTGMMQLLSNAGTVVAVMVILFGTQAALAGVSLLLVAALVVIAIRIGGVMRPSYTAIQQQIGEINTFLQENLTGIRIVKAFGREDDQIARFRSLNDRFLQTNVSTVRLRSFYFPLLDTTSGVGTALVLLYGGWQVVNGQLSLGQLVAFIGYLGQLVMPVRFLGWQVNNFQQAIAAGSRIFEVLDTRSEIADAPDAVEPPRFRGHVRFEGVRFAYAGGRPILDGIDLDVPAGTAVAIVGPTGSGKTTLVNLIPRFYDPTEGRVSIDGVDVRRYKLHGLRAQIGFVSQDTFLFSLTIRENIAFGRKDATMDEVVAAAKAARIHDFIASLPEGYNTVVGERGIDLSGGQKQRLSIARALVTDPAILILDDSTSSVDPGTELLIQQALAEVMRGRTTFVIAQRLSTLKLADVVVVLQDGRIVQQGTHAELLAQPGLYREIYEMQFKDQEEEAAVASASGESRPWDGRSRVAAGREG